MILTQKEIEENKRRIVYVEKFHWGDQLSGSDLYDFDAVRIEYE